jgi:3-hydroxyacyl-[acyl-carrier-protein] dehydratase
MPRKPIIKLGQIDTNKVVASIEDIRKVIPHRHEFEMLSGILHQDLKNHRIVAYKDVKEDAFWARGHLPGRPIMPGVLIAEAAAQMTCYLAMRLYDNCPFIGFARLDNVRFRKQVLPPCKLILMAEVAVISSRHVISNCQAYVDSALVFEGKITGMRLPEPDQPTNK